MALTEQYLKAARTQTQMDTYIPAIAKEMRRQGMGSFAELWEKIEPLIEKHPDFFANLDFRHVNEAIHKDANFYKVFTKDGYTKNAYAVAAALNKSAEELFGTRKEKKPRIKSFEDATLALEVFGDSYDQRKFGPIAAVVKKEICDLVQQRVQQLTTLQADSVASVFGIAREKEMLREIGERRGVSHQAIDYSISGGVKAMRRDDTDGMLKSCFEPLF